MMYERKPNYLRDLLKELLTLPKETEWVEFKHNNDDPQKIGEYLSALANSAALFGKRFAYVVWGVDDDTRQFKGTVFKPSVAKHKSHPRAVMKRWRRSCGV